MNTSPNSTYGPAYSREIRNKRIVARLELGLLSDDIALEFGLTGARIRQIQRDNGISRSRLGTPVERIMRKVVKQDNGCWEFLGADDGRGYGHINVGGKIRKATRIVYEHFHGLLHGLDVLHRCDNPPCVNPEHLFAGTATDNGRDMVRKGRCGVAKITPALALRIRERAAGTWRMDKIIAAEFGVSRDIVRRIRNGHNWRVANG